MGTYGGGGGGGVSPAISWYFVLNLLCEANPGAPEHEAQAFVSDPSEADPSTCPRHGHQGPSLLQ